MKIDAVRHFSFSPVAQDYSARDSILYALGLGYGTNPLDPAQLQFVYETGLKAVPSMVNVLAHPGMWVKDPALGINWTRLLHGAQSFELMRPLPSEGTLTGHYEITAVEDLGVKTGARLYLTKHLRDAQGGLIAEVRSTYILREDGGCGGFGTPDPSPAILPNRSPDRVVLLDTLPQQALLYRLNGDWNPLHADPGIAAQAGYGQPILHGLCSLGLATRALISALIPHAPDRLRKLSLRFSRPVLPGDSIAVQIYDLGQGEYGFRAVVPARDETVLDRGFATLSAH